MPRSRKPKLEIRFRTKKQKADFSRAAKEAKISLNEYILRATEDKYENSVTNVVPVVSALYQHSAVDR